LRHDLGDGYVDALESCYGDVGDAIDFVMYFWNHASELVQSRQTRRAGLITTNSIRMIRNQSVVRRALASGCRIVFAIPDHPWPSSTKSAKVRVAMTVLAAADDSASPQLLLAKGHDEVARSRSRTDDIQAVELTAIPCDEINADLAPGISIERLRPLKANDGISNAGMKPYAESLIISEPKSRELFPDDALRRVHAPPYRNGQDVARRPRNVHVLDFYGMNESQVAEKCPAAYQYLLDFVHPERSTDRDQGARTQWWLFQRSRPDLRVALKNLPRYIATVENSPVRYFVFLEGHICPDQKLRVIAHDDSFVLGVLSTTAHEVFSRRLGGRQGVANTPVYNTRCLTWFPFPLGSERQVSKIRMCAEELIAHRQNRLDAHPGLGMTSIYSVLSKLKSGSPLTKSEKGVHDKALCSVLLKLHEKLDAAVHDAYGWPAVLSDDEILANLVALNIERQEQERRGTIHWLRPHFQSKPHLAAQGLSSTQGAIDDDDDDDHDLAENPNATGRTSTSGWPAARVDRVRAIGAALESFAAPATSEEIARTFKGAQIKAVDEILCALATLGQIRLVEGGRFTP